MPRVCSYLWISWILYSNMCNKWCKI